MPKYVSTFVSGFQDAVKNLLQDRFDGLVILEIFDGIVVYETDKKPIQIRDLKLFNNSFLLMDFIRNVKNPIDTALRKLAKNNKKLVSVTNTINELKPKTFRIVTSLENKLTSIDQNLRKSVENRISATYEIKPDRLNPDIEFWILARSEGFVLTCLRITQNKNKERALLKGELRPEIAYLLCCLSEPTNEDVFLDPFCGYGSIPLERSSLQGFKQIIASDMDKSKLTMIRERILENNISLFQKDFFSKESFGQNSIDKIVTDPPWGDFATLDLETDLFYCKFLNQASYVLKENGLLIFITSKKNETEKAIEINNDSFKLVLKLDILVSGKKVGLYKLKKI